MVLVIIGIVYAGQRTPSRQARSDRNTITLSGFDDIHFGESRSELTARHGLRTTRAGCRPRFTDRSQLGPVFVDGKLAMLWADPPLHTPEGVSVGTTVTQARQSYPDAVSLPPPGPYRYAGLLATKDGMGYLFLYQDDAVDKMVVGYENYLRQTFPTAASSC